MLSLALCTLLTLQSVGASATYYYLGKGFQSKKAAPFHPAGRRGPTRTRRDSYIDASVKTANPFISDNFEEPIVGYERVKMAFMTVTILPLRLLLVAGAVGSAALWSTVALRVSGATETDISTKPLPRFVKVFFGSIVRCHVRFLLFCLGFYWIGEDGKNAGPDVAPILISNHYSFIEPLYFLAQGLVSPVGAVDNLRSPIIGPILKLMQAITVDRADPKSRHNVVEQMRARGNACGSGEGKWGQTLIFPEGTTTNGKALISFKKGAFLPGVSVQPCSVRYPHGHMDPCWVWAGPSVGMVAYRLLCQFVNRLEVRTYGTCGYLSFIIPSTNMCPQQVRYHPVYAPSKAEQKDPGLFAANVRRSMAKVMGVEATAHSLEDVKLCALARKLGMPVQDAVVEMGTITNIFDCTPQTVAKYVSNRIISPMG
jgi:lysophosphatidylcholine acyltransferase/lyso-PAF acetyltransferase